MKFFHVLFFWKEEELSAKHFLLISVLGPICLLLGLTCVLLKYAPLLWPIIATACAGFFLTLKWKKAGFIFSSILLISLLFGSLRAQDPMWSLLLSTSVVLGWLLVLLGHREVRFWIENTENKCHILKEQNTSLLVQLQKGKENARLKHEQLVLEISHFQRKEKAFQHALEEAQVKYAKPSQLESQKEESEEMLKAISDIRYKQLKEQFEEKSEILYQTRKQLFTMESQFLLLQRQSEEMNCDPSQEDVFLFDHMKQIQEENEQLELHISALQECISTLLNPKKSNRPKKQKKDIQRQEDLFNSLSKFHNHFL